MQFLRLVLAIIVGLVLGSLAIQVLWFVLYIFSKGPVGPTF